MRILSVFLLAGSVLSASVSAKASFKPTCGAGSKVLNSTTIIHKDKEIKVTTTFCPDFSPSSGKRSTSLTARAAQKKRQIAQCDSNCEVECADLGEQPFMGDCQDLTDALESLYPASFNAPAQTVTSFWEYSCQYSFYNFDSFDYSVCYLDLGYNGAITANDCFGDWPAPQATSGGLCASPGFSGDDWILEVSYPT